MIASNDTTIGIRWLKAGELAAEWDAGAARLTVRLRGEDREFADARPAQAFPVSAPGEMIEISDRKGEPVGVLWSLEDLDEASREALEAALSARYMVPRITGLLDLAETAPFVLRWRASTDRGDRVFYTESTREAIRFHNGDGLRITDLAGDQYELPSIAELDGRSRTLLATVI
jgi:hypothetical protein